MWCIKGEKEVYKYIRDVVLPRGEAFTPSEVYQEMDHRGLHTPGKEKGYHWNPHKVREVLEVSFSRGMLNGWACVSVINLVQNRELRYFKAPAAVLQFS